MKKAGDRNPDKGGPDYFFGGAANPVAGISPGRKIALFLDFDGTLVPIRKDPDKCVLSPEIKEQLRSLANSGRHFVAVLSGRTLADIKSRVGIRNICYGGNHGLTISGKGMGFIYPGALLVLPGIDKAGCRLEKEIARFDGARVEWKKFTLSLHYRLVDKEDIPALKRVFYGVAAEFSGNKLLTVMKGKRVLELQPASWDKGKAVHWILNRLESGYLPLFIGDDVTDEAAFKALKNRGITVRIGRSKRSLARFYLKDYGETLRLLETVLSLAP